MAGERRGLESRFLIKGVGLSTLGFRMQGSFGLLRESGLRMGEQEHTWTTGAAGCHGPGRLGGGGEQLWLKTEGGTDGNFVGPQSQSRLKEPLSTKGKGLWGADQELQSGPFAAPVGIWG